MMKMVMTVLIFIILFLFISGCSSGEATKTDMTNNDSENPEIEGSVTISPATPNEQVTQTSDPNSATVQGKQNKTTQELLFETNAEDFIILDGKSISIDGKVKEMNVDLNGDGNLESFSIGRDHPNGVLILGVANETGQNFADDINLDYASNSDAINDDYFVQVTCLDFDNDNTKEIAVSIGNMLIEMQTLIYRYTNSTDQPFEYVGKIEGQEKMMVKDNGNIIAPFGSQGLNEEYKYVDKKLYYYDSNGTLEVVLDQVDTITDSSELPMMENQEIDSDDLTIVEPVEPIQPPEKKEIYSHWAESGAVIVKQSPDSPFFSYKQKCEVCGFVSSSTYQRTGVFGTLTSSFKCSKCGNSQKIVIGSSVTRN